MRTDWSRVQQFPTVRLKNLHWTAVKEHHVLLITYICVHIYGYVWFCLSLRHKKSSTQITNTNLNLNNLAWNLIKTFAKKSSKKTNKIRLNYWRYYRINQRLVTNSWNENYEQPENNRWQLTKNNTSSPSSYSPVTKDYSS